MVKATTTSILRSAAVLALVVGGSVQALAEEVLPWANSSPATVAAPPAVDPEMQAAIAQCAGQFEASCRGIKTCAWVASVKLTDGSVAPARCMALRPAPPKSAAADATPAVAAMPTPPPKKKGNAKPPAMKAAAAPAAATQPKPTETGALPAKAAETQKSAPEPPVAPVVVTRPDAEARPVAEKKTPAPAPTKAAAVEAPATPPALPVNRNAAKAITATTESDTVKKPSGRLSDEQDGAPSETADSNAEKPAKAAAAKPEKAGKTKEASAGEVPPSSPAARAASPSFGAFNSAFPIGSAVVTTTVPPSSSE